MIYTAKTESGQVRGMTSGDTHITVFKGVPFAAPPVGKNRWRVPQPVEPWEGIRDCYLYGDAGMQDRYTGTGFYDREFHNDVDQPMSEDCLYLNIWTPAKTPGEKLPVMIWIYGGGLQGGHNAEMEFDGERIASRGVVLVHVSYRTNVFAWFAHPEITAECGGVRCTNFGLFDQKAGIDWVGRNIAAFGGDPDNITIFGPSAGGRSVVSQIVSPLNENGYIKKAITQSSTGLNFALGGHGTDYYTLKEAEEVGVRFFQKLGVRSLEEARALPAEVVRDAGAAFRDSREGQWQFIVDGCFLPDQPITMLAQNRRLQIPVMTGSTTNEHFDVIRAASLEEFERNARTLYGEYADEFLELCDFKCGDLEKILAATRVNGSAFGSRLLAMRAKDAGLPVWLYVFDPETTTPACSTPPICGSYLRRSISAGGLSAASTMIWRDRSATIGRILPRPATPTDWMTTAPPCPAGRSSARTFPSPLFLRTPSTRGIGSCPRLSGACINWQRINSGEKGRRMV